MILVLIGAILVALEITLFAWWGWTRHRALDRAIVRRRMLEQPREDDYEQFMAERERLLEAANRRR